MSCLVIKNDGIGDLILASGLIADLARELGPLDLVTCEANREVADHIPGIRETHFLSRDGLRYRGLGLRLGLKIPRIEKQDRDALFRLRQRSYDVAICLRRYIRQSTLIVMGHVNARRRICAWLYPTNATRSMAECHSKGWERYRGSETGSELSYYRTMVAEHLGVQSVSPPRLLLTEGKGPRPVKGRVGLIIAGHSTNWSDDQWIQLARELHGTGKKLTIFGGVDSIPLGRSIQEAAPGSANLAGRATLQESVDPLREMEIVVGNDTGLTHFATLCACRVLVILGGGTFGRFFPWPGARNQYVVYRSMECYDCDWQCKFSTRRCLEAVDPGQVVALVHGVLAGVAKPMNDLAPEAARYTPGWRYNSNV